VAGWVAGVDVSLGVGDLEGVVGEEFGVPAGRVQQVEVLAAAATAVYARP
jgi:hypothetical protein